MPMSVNWLLPAIRVTKPMFIESAQAVADQVPSETLKQGLLFPLQSSILASEIQTAARKHVHKPEYASVTARI